MALDLKTPIETEEAGEGLVIDVAPPAIEARGVSRWYGNVVAVNDISFSLKAGITGLLGPNGAGKSTLLHMLSGLLQPSNGDVRIMGQPVWMNPSIYSLVGLVPEKESVYGFLTGLDFVKLSARLHNLPDIEEASLRALGEVDMLDAKDRATGGYSKGMKQRVKIAAALVHQPRILFLDEPFNGTDPRQRLRLMEMLRRMVAGGTTVIFSSHILEEVERLADNVLVIVNGRLAASGEFREIRRLMTERPHTFTVRTNDNRAFAGALMSEPTVFGVEVKDEVLIVRTSDLGRFARLVPRVAQEMDVTIYDFVPTDESLESVFSYLVKR